MHIFQSAFETSLTFKRLVVGGWVGGGDSHYLFLLPADLMLKSYAANTHQISLLSAVISLLKGNGTNEKAEVEVWEQSLIASVDAFPSPSSKASLVVTCS